MVRVLFRAVKTAALTALAIKVATAAAHTVDDAWDKVIKR